MNQNKTNNSTTTVAIVNKQKIQVLVENGNEFVPIRPICDALGIDAKSQRDRIKRDQILSSTEVTMTSVGADGKNREMTVLPLRFVFGWLFTIDSNLGKEESRPIVLQYQLECYNALYDHFKSYVDFVDFRQEQIDEALIKYDEARTAFSGAKTKLKEAREEFDEKRQIDYQSFLDSKRQLKLEFTEIRSTEEETNN
jgi:hypothetical protein